MKQCKQCGSTRFIPVKRKHTDGTPYMSSRCKDCANSYAKKNRHITRQWQQDNRDHVREYQREYYNFQERNAKYSKDLASRTPSWANKEEIIEFYRNCPEGYHVDHIIPLRGKNVSGLHIRSNLQYLTAEKNLRKSNKFEQ